VLVFPLDFRFQFGDASFIDVDGVDPRLLESGCAVLEELFQPGIENGRLKIELVADVRDALVLDEVPTKDLDLLIGGEMTTRLTHGSSSRLEKYNTV
jgi:hypothetical protein